MDIEVTHNVSENLWKNFVLNHADGNIFHTPEMWQVFNQAKHHHPDKLFIVDTNGQIVTLFVPICLTMPGKLFKQFTARSVAYGSVLTLPTEQGLRGLDLLLEYYQRNLGKLLFTELRNLTNLDYLQPVLAKHKYIYEDHLNYLINLNRPIETVWRNISKSARKKIRKASNKNRLVMEQVSAHNEILLRTWYNLLKMTYQNASVPLVDFSLFKAAQKLLSEKGMVQFLLGRVDDRYVAASVALLYKDVIYGWYRGFDRDFSAYLPNDLMVWHLLKWGTENGYTTFDFGGAGKPNQDYGPGKFKAKFGGDLVCFGRNTCVHSLWKFKLSKYGYELGRRFLW